MPTQMLDSLGPRPAIPLPRLSSSAAAAAAASASASEAVRAMWNRGWYGAEAMTTQKVGESDPEEDGAETEQTPTPSRHHRFQRVQLGGQSRLVLIELHPTRQAALRVWDCTDSAALSAPEWENGHDLASSVESASAPKLILHLATETVESWSDQQQHRIVDVRFGDDASFYLLLSGTLVLLDLLSARVVAKLAIRGNDLQVSNLAVAVTNAEALHLLHPRTLQPLISPLPAPPPSFALCGRLLALVTTQTRQTSEALQAPDSGSIVTNTSVIADNSPRASRGLWSGVTLTRADSSPRWIKIFDLRRLEAEGKLGSRALVAHFTIPSTEVREPPSLLSFSPDGTRLAVAAVGGRTVVVVDIRPRRPPRSGEVWVRYLLRRGMTPAAVRSISWDDTGRLLAVSTDRTSHVFHLHPEGGVPPDQPFERTQNQDAQPLSTVMGPIVRLRVRGEVAIGGGGGLGTVLGCHDGIVVKHALKPPHEPVTARQWNLEAREGQSRARRIGDARLHCSSPCQVTTTTFSQRLPPVIYSDRHVTFGDPITDEPRAYRPVTCEITPLDDPSCAIDTLLDPSSASPIMPALPNGRSGWAALKLRRGGGRRDMGASESPTKYGDHFVSDEETGFVNDENQSLGESWDEELAGRMD